MKRAYSKPSIYVEPIKIDMPIAATCFADRADINALMMFGHFTEERNCTLSMDAIAWGDNTICYHTNVQIAFMS